MKPLYHYHATFEGISVDEVKAIAATNSAKVTEIDLQDENGEVVLRDRMITRYARSYDDCMTNALLVKHDKLVRVKIERVVSSLTNEMLDGAHYLEVHAKVPEDFEYKGNLFKRSLNPVQGNVFLNARLYSVEQLEKFNEEIKTIPYLKIQKEVALYDTNLDRDHFWAV